jgi:hypothetical protein
MEGKTGWARGKWKGRIGGTSYQSPLVVPAEVESAPPTQSKTEISGLGDAPAAMVFSGVAHLRTPLTDTAGDFNPPSQRSAVQ